jgi:hypothetical protein
MLTDKAVRGFGADGNDLSICLYQQAGHLASGSLHYAAGAEDSIQLAVGIESRQAKWDPAHQNLVIRLESECLRIVHLNAGEAESRSVEGRNDEAGFAETKDLVIGARITVALAYKLTLDKSPLG